MSSETAKKKTCIFIAAVLVFTLGIFLYVNLQHLPGGSVSGGHYSFQWTDVFSYDVRLAGEWEFYPDVLLYSDSPEEWPEPVPVQVPDRWAGNREHVLPSGGNASYRLVIDDYKPAAGHSNIVFSLMGFFQDCKVFINGSEKLMRNPSPTGYPLYSVDETGSVEIVVELKNTSAGLTAAPSLWAIGVRIGAVDNAGNFLFIASTLFFILFVMFLVFSFSQSAQRLRPAAILGLLMTALYLSHTVWTTGYLDTVSRIIPGSVWNLICIGLRLAVTGWGIEMFCRTLPENSFRRCRHVCRILLFCAMAVQVVPVYLLHFYSGWFLTYVLTGAAVFLWTVMTVYSLLKLRKDCLEQAMELIVVFGMTGLCWTSDWYPEQTDLLVCIPIAVSCVTVFCFVNYYRYQQESLRRMKELLEAERFAGRTQTAMLSSQIQPHFLYNTLLTIQELCRFDPAEASRVIVRFSEYLRHNIDFMNYSELVPFAEEEKHIDNFIYIQEARFQDKLEFLSDIQIREFMIPPLTVQPIIENAIKYGVRSRINGGYVHLRVFEDAAGIHILVQNSGDGFDSSTIPQDHSLGNIRKRLKTLLNALLIIRSETGKEGAEVEIFIPAANVIRNEEEIHETGISG